MKTPADLLKEFNKMPLGKQSLIAVATLGLIITFLSNYKNIKDCTTSFIDKFTNDENVKEFLSDVDKVVKSFFGLTNKFFKGESPEQEKQQLND